MDRVTVVSGFTDEAKETLLHYRWPGNIRELKNVVERSVYRHGTSDYPLNEIVIDPFRRHAAPPLAQETRHTSVTLPLDLREFQQQQEKEFLQTSLQQAKFNQKKAAELLGLTYHQLRALLKKTKFSVQGQTLDAKLKQFTMLQSLYKNRLIMMTLALVGEKLTETGSPVKKLKIAHFQL